MTNMEMETKTHPTEAELAGFLDDSLSARERERLEVHIAECRECLEKIVSAHESVKAFNKKGHLLKGKDRMMKRLNIYLILAVISFALSFAFPRHFIQLLVATLVLGIKWVVDSRTTRMLVMIYDAWKSGGSSEASRIIEKMDSGRSDRF